MKISLVVLPAALMLTGCVSNTKPYLYAVDSVFKGTDFAQPQQSFSKGKTPVIYARLGVHDPKGVVIRVLRIPDRRLIVEEHSLPGIRDWTSQPIVIPLQGLAVGKYTVELWIKGELVNTLDISINDAGRS